jgi:GNAT superfamily N-acetyltransferase
MPEILDITQEINGAHRMVFVVLERGQIVGTADIAWDDNQEPVLCNVFVIEAVRGRGIGTQLVNSAKCWSQTAKRRLWLRVVPGELVSWYATLGFIETGETDGEFLWMQRDGRAT